MSIPCAWDVSCAVVPNWDTYTDDQKNTALWLASTFMWGATGRQYGVCPMTVRPGQRRWDPWTYEAYPVWPGQDPIVSGPFLFNGRWFNAGCGSACCGNKGCAIVLRGPVAAVDQVLVDGEEIPSADYRVDVANGAYLLVRTDGLCWPACQNFTAEADQPGTFEVTYELGKALPPALSIATALLAGEYAKSLIDAPCALPAKMTSLTRQGVTVEVEPPAPDDGKTGIREVDDIIAVLNPSGLKSPPRVMSPDLPETCDRRTVWRGSV